MVNHLSDSAKHAVDAVSAGTIIAAFFSWLPEVSALLAAVWFLLRIANEVLDRRIKQQEYQINARKLKE